MDPERTIVVTGIGVASPPGPTPEDLWRAAARGESPAVWFADPAAPEGPRVPACIVAGPDEEQLRRHRSHRLDRCVQLAFEAAFRARADARLDAAPSGPGSLGLIVGTSRGPMQKWTESLDRARSGRHQAVPTQSATTTLDSLSGSLSLALGAGGPCMTVSATCASGAYAIALAAQQILLGTAEIMFAGGTDAPLQDVIVRQLVSSGMLGSHPDPRRACRPFDATRDGTLLGEGAGILVLESLASARRRGAPVRARLLGWAVAADAKHRSAPRDDGEGLLHAMRGALKIAGLDASALDYVNTHGTGTRLNDRIETLALRRLLGDRLRQVACSSTKPVTGHCLGAVSALEAIITVLSIQHQLAPPTANHQQPDPECSLDLVTEAARPMRIHVAMSNSLGFWGKNAALVFGLAGADA